MTINQTAQKKMNKFLERYKLTKLALEEIHNVNSQKNSNYILKHSHKKIPDPDDFTAEVYPRIKVTI